MADIESGMINKLKEGIPKYEADMVGMFDTMLNKAMRQVGSSSAKEFADGWKKAIDEKDLSFNDKFKRYMNQYTQLSRDAEEVRSRYFNSYERQRLDRFNDTYAKNKKTLEDFYAKEKELIEKNKALNPEGKLIATGDMEKKKIEDLARLDKASRKERRSLELEDAAVNGNIWEKATAKAQLAGMSMFKSLGAGGIAAIAGAFSIEKISNVLSESTKLSAARAGAGGAGGPVGRGNIFGALPMGITSPIEQMQMTTEILKSAPNLIKDSAIEMRSFTGFMGYFGMNVEESTKVLIRAQRNLGLQTRDVTDIISMSTIMNSKYGISVNESSDRILEMTGSLRMVGLGAKDAAALMMAIPDKTALGKVSPEELKSYTSSLSSFIGGMAPSQMAGLIAFSKGGGIPSDREMRGTNMIGTIGSIYQRIKEQTGEMGQQNPMFVAEAFTKQLGLGIPINLKSMETLDNIMNNLKPGNMDELYKQLATSGLQPTEDILKEGFGRVADIAGTMKNIDNVLQNVFVPLAGTLGPVLTGLNNAVQAGGAASPVIAGTGAGALAGFSLGGPVGAGVGGLIGLFLSLLSPNMHPAGIPGRM